MGTELPGTRRAAGRPRRRHRSAFKALVALEAVKGQKTLNELAREYGVHLVQNAQQKRQLLDASTGIFEGGSTSWREREQEQLVGRLYQEIGQLKMEVDQLRKKEIARSSWQYEPHVQPPAARTVNSDTLVMMLPSE